MTLPDGLASTMKRSVTVNISQFAADALVSVRAVGAEGAHERARDAL